MVDEVAPAEAAKGLLFTLEEISYSPETPRMKEPFTVKGKIELLRLPFLGPLWVIATVTYPETWWEEIIPIIGSPEVRENTTALGGNFEITFKKGFEREGEFSLAVRAYAGPTRPLDTMTLPPFPPVSTYETTFTVSGEVPPEERPFKKIEIISYDSEVSIGGTCNVKVRFTYEGPATSKVLYAAIGNVKPVVGFDEILSGSKTISIPESATATEYEGEVSISITAKIDPAGSPYDLYAKIDGVFPDIISDYLEDVITVTGVAPGQGQITSLYINKAPEGNKIPLPTTVTADGNTFEVGVRAKNTSPVSFTGGIEVKVYDPTGALRASPTVDYTGIAPNEELGWEYNICKVDKAGDWKIKVRFLTKDGTILDEKEATMTAKAIQYTGSIVSKYINKSPEGNQIPLPTTVTADGNTFEVGVTAKNTATVSYVAGVEVEVYDPSGALRASPTIDWAGISPGETLRWEYNICKVDKAGSWTIKIRFLEKTTSTVIAEAEATMTAKGYTGAVTSATINKAPEGSNIPLPTTVTADGNTFEVAAKAKNTSTSTYYGNVEITVYDPDNISRFTSPINWAGVSPNEELRWGPYNVCKVDKAGSWTIKVRFIEKTTSAVIEEKSFTMTAKAIQYTGSIVSKYINKAPEGNQIPLPTTVTADGNTFEVGVTAKNTATVSYVAGIEVKVYDPSGALRASPTIDWAGISPGETLRWEYNICKVDKAGSWKIGIRFIEKTTSTVIAEAEATMTAKAVEYKGSITSAWINKSPEGSKIGLPTTVTADGNTFELGVQARNTATIKFNAGVEIKVYDPGGTLRFSPVINYAAMSAGQELVWGPYNVCKVDKVGAWTISLRFIEQSTSTVLDQKTFTMTAKAVQYSGSIISKYINKSPEGSRIELPTTVKADGNTFEVGVTAKNTATVSYVAGVEVKVYDPSGALRASPTIDWAGISPGETLRWEYNACKVDKAGSWTIKIRFLEQSTSTVLAETQSTMTATEVAISFKAAQKNAEYVFSGAQYWCCYYWDPGISNFVGDQKWYGLTSQIAFSNVKSGGYFAVFLLKDSQTSSQFTSPTFSAVNGGVYQYDLYYNTVSKIG